MASVSVHLPLAHATLLDVLQTWAPFALAAIGWGRALWQSRRAAHLASHNRHLERVLSETRVAAGFTQRKTDPEPTDTNGRLHGEPAEGSG